MASAAAPVAGAVSSAERRAGALGVVLGTFVTSRLLIAGMVALSRLGVVPGPFWQKGGLVGALTSGDAATYVRLAQNDGWSVFAAPDLAVAFFPVYPLLVHLMSFLTIGNAAAAALIVANAALLATGFLLYQLLVFEGYSAVVRRGAVTFLMFSPASYFFSSGVPDSTALALAIACLLAARRTQWVLAAGLAICLCGTTNVGFWIIVPLALEAVLQSRSRQLDGGAKLSPSVFLLALIPLHAAALLMLSASRGRWPLAPLRLAIDWKRAYQRLIDLSEMFLAYRTFYEWLFWAVIIASVALCVIGWRMRMRPSYLAFAATLIAGCIWSHDMEVARTLGVGFPFFVALGMMTEKNAPAADLALTCSMTLLLLLTLVAANGFWLT